jgi:hypothetical protein
LNVYAIPPTASNPLLLAVPVNVMELEVNEVSPKVPERRMFPGFGVTLSMVEVRPLIVMAKVPAAGSVLP